MNKLVQKYPVLGSSANPEKIALTVKAIIAGIATILVYFGIVLPMDDISPLIDLIGTLVAQISAVASSVALIVGLVRKIYTAFKK